MKFLQIVLFAIFGLVVAAQLPDSATQGPNPQDIATPEPEYIDIDLPEPPRPAAPAPAPKPSFAAPRAIPRPVISAPVISAPAPVSRNYLAPVQQQIPGHVYSKQSGYQYRRPVYVRRVYRRRF